MNLHIVIKGYQAGTDDEPASAVFIKILGKNYDTATFGNACATRVSLGLINGGMRIKPAFKI
ncbi:hypothetical protein [Neisseria chenwenguii]|uniref:hypothetical protein n=1 Tax=Neisseria chenwenguii TaxID=1853278 RepID=UPI000F4E54A4|nr:hypothetical protein [Neisseria chenwenguii]